MDASKYMNTCISIINSFDEIAPYEKYSGGDSSEFTLLMSEIRNKNIDEIRKTRKQIKNMEYYIKNTKPYFESIKRGDVDGVSFGFYIRDNGDKWEYLKEEDVYERTLLDIDLIEISPTPFPAYPTSEVGKRSLSDYNLKNKEERILDELKKAQVNAMIEILKI